MTKPSDLAEAIDCLYWAVLELRDQQGSLTWDWDRDRETQVEVAEAMAKIAVLAPNVRAAMRALDALLVDAE